MASEIADQVKAIMRSLPLKAGPTSLDEQRAGAEKFWPLLTAEVEGARYEPIVVAERKAELIHLEGADSRKAVLYLHGGGYSLGSTATHRKLAAHLCKAAGRHGLIIDYRLAPEHPFPAGLDDAVAAFNWLEASGVASSDILIAGDSAGGGLALALALRLRDERKPAEGLVLFSPWTDLAFTGDSIASKKDVDLVLRIDVEDNAAVESYLGDSGADVKDPLVSPLYADLSGLPRMLVQVGEDEVLLDDSRRLAEKAEAEGVDVTIQVWPEMFHVFQIGAGFLPESDQALAAVADWLGADSRRRP